MLLPTAGTGSLHLRILPWQPHSFHGSFSLSTLECWNLQPPHQSSTHPIASSTVTRSLSLRYQWILAVSLYFQAAYPLWVLGPYFFPSRYICLDSTFYHIPWFLCSLSGFKALQSILKEISPGCSLEGMMLKLKLQYFGHLMRSFDSLAKTLMLGGIGGRRRRGWQRMRWLDSITN